MIEVEVRSLVYPSIRKNVWQRLAHMHLAHSGRSLDRYYDTPDFALLRHPQMVFFRLREERLLQVKFDADMTLHQPPPCIEREFALNTDTVPPELHELLQTFRPGWQSAQSWQELLRCNDLEELVRIDKHRRVYTDGPFIVCLDDVANLGQFIEIEINCPEDADIREAQVQVENFLSEIGGTSLKAGYFELYLYYHKHEAYRLIPERFQVEEALLPIPSWKGTF
jgi:adenylate cyclase class 2